MGDGKQIRKLKSLVNRKRRKSKSGFVLNFASLRAFCGQFKKNYPTQ